MIDCIAVVRLRLKLKELLGMTVYPDHDERFHVSSDTKLQCVVGNVSCEAVRLQCRPTLGAVVNFFEIVRPITMSDRR